MIMKTIAVVGHYNRLREDLTNMRLIRILLFSVFLVLSMCISLQTNSSKTSLTSTLRDPIERVFSRKKRWLVFPKGSALKFTLSVSKRLLALYPKGFNFNLEAAVYYPVPSARIDLIPKRFRKPTTKPKPKGPTPLSLIGIPGSLIKYRVKPATRAPIVQRIDLNSSTLQWASSPTPLSSSIPTYLHYNNPEQWSKWSKYGTPEYLNKYQWSPEKQHKYVDKYSNNKWSKWTMQKPQTLISNSNNKWNWNQRTRYGRDLDDFDYLNLDDSDDFEYEPIYFEDLEPFKESPHYHAYRGRRELFHHFEGLTTILGIDMKSCILRAMCDSKRFLLPPGYSMIQDILRVILTFPTISGLQDDYSRVMKTDYQTCDTYIHNKCPFSLLDMLMNLNKSL